MSQRFRKAIEMDSLRTPDTRFENLPDYPFTPNYVDDLPNYVSVRIHFVDTGPHNAEQTFLCLHGEPTWSYLYRKMMPVFAAAGHRAVAPDFIGFGKSDKPVDDHIYTFDFHRKMLIEFVERLDLQNIILVCQDWGGLLGLTLPLAMPERFIGLLVMNTTLGTGDGPLSQGFLDWRAWVAKNPDMAVGKLMSRTCPHLSPEEIAAYDAPFPDARYKAGVRRFPQIVPDHLDASGAAISRQARDWWKNSWQGKTIMAVGMTDPVLGPAVMRELAKNIRNCPEPTEISDAGHFVPEWGADIARSALQVF
jgi:haloalkane dehalogenase